MRRLTLLLLALGLMPCACSDDDNPAQPPGSSRRTLTFALQPSTPLTTVPLSTIASGDFNRDGNMDLATASGESALVYIALGRGDGSFHAPRRVSAAAGYIVAGDWDDDDNRDLAVNSSGSGTIFLYGRGDGDFDSLPVGTPYLNPSTPASGDFNGDGIDDYVGQQFDSVVVVLGDAGRMHTSVVTHTALLPSGYGFWGAGGVAADLDGNGASDYAVAGLGTANHMDLYYGNGDGTFQAPSALADAGWDAGACSIRRADSAGGRDLAVTHNVGEGTVGVLRRAGGGFAAEVTYPTGQNPWDVGAADFDLDGFEDLAVANYSDMNVAVLLGRADGTFDPAEHYNAGSLPQQLEVADWNNDGLPDIAVIGNRAIFILLNTSK